MKIKVVLFIQRLGLVIMLAPSAFLSLAAMSNNSIFDQSRLDHVALTEGYGYKYANLRELEQRAEQINQNQPAYTIAIPIFAGIPSSHIQKFLEKEGLNLTAQWAELIKKYFSSLNIQDDTIATKQYPDGFLSDCQTLENDIRNAFDRAVSSSIDKTFDTTDIDALITQIPDQKERLMVRSTGKEDTKTLANAGGNESVSNVETTTPEILRAMRDVVASYFGEKSLTQRLDAGDRSLFEPTPFTPVLIQRMIGEKDPKQLPKCGVMFTEEAEGGLSRIDPKRTSGITVIQCAYGHNEAVVNSRIPIDTFYVDATKNIYTILRPKTYRMVPSKTEKRKLDLVKNEGSIIQSPSLNKDALLSLKTVANALEAYYKDPMDVEFVVDEEAKIVYLVQARPIVHKSKLPPASYLINPETLSDPKFIGCAIGVAGGSLRWCTDKNQIIVAGSINDALNRYQEKEFVPDTTTIQSVIVGKPAPETSHEATTFRSEGKPVIFIDQWQTVEQWTKQASCTLLISPQQHMVINWSGKERSTQELIDANIAVKGWVSYPIPPFVSLSKEFVPDRLLTDQAIKTFLPRSISWETLTKVQFPPLKTILKIVKNGTPDQASFALANFLYHIPQIIKEKSDGLELDADQIARITLFKQYALYFAQCIKQNLHYTPTDLEYTKRLFPIRFLESLMFQQPKFNTIIDGESAATLIIHELDIAQKITRELSAAGISLEPISILYMRISALAMTPELETHWKQFVIDFDKQGDITLKDNFRQLIGKLGKLDMLPIWLHTSFALAAQADRSDATKIAHTLIAQYTSQHAFLDQLFEKKTEIEALNVDTFGNPKSFASQWQTLKDNLLTYFESDDFCESFDETNVKTNNFRKLAALGVMTKFVNFFDVSIKAVTGSSQYTTEEKVERFRTMLKGYRQLFEAWGTIVPKRIIRYDDEEQEAATVHGNAQRDQDLEIIPEGAIPFHPNAQLDRYFEIIDHVITMSDQGDPKAQLQGTKDFDVAAFAIGAAALLGDRFVAFPKTLEDVFTLIHQSLLVIQKALSATAGAKDIARPPLLAKIEQQLLNVAVEDQWAKDEDGEWPNGEPVVRSPNVIGLEMLPGSISFFYNLPLHSHSAQFELSYNKKKESVILKTRFVGNDSWRWARIAHFGGIIGLCIKATIKNVAMSNNGCSFELEFNQNSKIDHINEFVTTMAKLTFIHTMSHNQTDYDSYIEQLLPTETAQQSMFIDILAAQFGVANLVEDSWFMDLLTNVARSGEIKPQIQDALNYGSAVPATYFFEFPIGNRYPLDNTLVKYKTASLAEAVALHNEHLPDNKRFFSAEILKAAETELFNSIMAPSYGWDRLIRETSLNTLISLARQHYKVDELNNIAARAQASVDQLVSDPSDSEVLSLKINEFNEAISHAQ